MYQQYEVNQFSYLSLRDLYSFERLDYKSRIFSFLWTLSFEYPRFSEWYEKLFAADGQLQPERQIYVCTYAKDVCGVIILKKDDLERKVCTLRVSPKYQRNGIGRQLLTKGIEWLEDDKPLITVRGSRKHQFNNLFSYFGFKEEQCCQRYYSFFSNEYAYNCPLTTGLDNPRQFEIADILDAIDWFLQSGATDTRLIIEYCIRKWNARQIFVSSTI